MNNIKKLLIRISDFVTVSDSLSKKLSCLFKEKTIKKNEFFDRQGEYAKKIGFIINGIFRAYYINYEGKEYNKTFFVETDFIASLTSLLTNTENKINIQALTDSVILTADYNDVISFFNEYRELETLFRKILEYKFILKEEREIQIVLESASQRYLRFKNEYPHLENSVPAYHIASYLGITPVQLSRIKNQKN